MYRLLLFITFLLSVSANAQNDQINPRKLDSLKQHIDANAKAVRQLQDSFKKRQDSIYYAQMNKRIEQNVRGNYQYLKDLQKQHQRQVYIRIAVGVIFLALVALGLARKRKKPSGLS